jgi:hypothetical protein
MFVACEHHLLVGICVSSLNLMVVCPSRRRLLRFEASYRVAMDRAGGSQAGHVSEPDLRRAQPRRDTADLKLN